MDEIVGYVIYQLAFEAIKKSVDIQSTRGQDINTITSLLFDNFQSALLKNFDFVTYLQCA